METMEKSMAGKVKRRTWVKDATHRKGHYRMQWVNPENDKAEGGKGQIDLFREATKTAAPKSEKAPVSDFKVYHDSFTSVVDEVIKNLEGRGLYMDEDDVWDQISMGPGKPKNGRTDRYNLPLFDKDGKPAKKGVAFQVADLGSRYELNMYVTPHKEKDYTKENGKVRKPAAEPENQGSSDSDLTLTEQFAKKGAVSAKSDGAWVDYLDASGQKVGTKKIGNASEAREEAETFNREFEGKAKEKPFEDMTFEAKKRTGKPANVSETVRDVLGMSPGTAAQFAGSSKVDDIEKFQYDAAKWAYETDKVGTGFDILDQYARHKGLRKSAFESFRMGIAKAFGTWR
jgi:hypothetical protein